MTTAVGSSKGQKERNPTSGQATREESNVEEEDCG